MIVLDSLFGVYCFFDMAFLYMIDHKLERYESNFHFWYVNGYKPDPKLKQEIVEEEAMRETHLSYSQSNREGGRHDRARSSWRK